MHKTLAGPQPGSCTFEVPLSPSSSCSNWQLDRFQSPWGQLFAVHWHFFCPSSASSCLSTYLGLYSSAPPPASRAPARPPPPPFFLLFSFLIIIVHQKRDLLIFAMDL